MYLQKTKWGRAKKSTYDGKAYDSRFEASYARDLTMRQKAGEIQGFDTHVRLPLEVNGYHIADYYIDFVVHHNDGTIEYAETKGVSTAVWILKFKILEAMISDNPDISLTLVQQKRFKLRKIRKM